MEFTAGTGRDARDLEKQATAPSAHRSPFPLPSPSASPAVFRRDVGPSGSGGGGGGGEDGGKDDEDCNFFLEKEHMFDKVVTPSDVGKLNRLVIPKQHAEKYFPLDPAANEKGLLLSFEDRTGKSWRFRYSYWNSSQSYVMTKGWSRFVKDKRLDAGDVVSFGRGLGEAARDRLYIDWKPRPENHHDLAAAFGRLPMAPLTGAVSYGRSLGPWGVVGGVADGARFFISPGVGYDNHHRPGFACNATTASAPTSGSHLLFFRSSAGTPMPTPPQRIGAVQHEISGGYGGYGGYGGSPQAVLNSLPLAASQAEAKRVRLFGVNLDGGRTPEARVGGGEAQLASDHRGINPELAFLPSPYMSAEPSMVAAASPPAEPRLTLDLGL